MSAPSKFESALDLLRLLRADVLTISNWDWFVQSSINAFAGSIQPSLICIQNSYLLLPYVCGSQIGSITGDLIAQLVKYQTEG